MLPSVLMACGGPCAGAVTRLPVRLPVLLPALPMQLIHEDDVGAALLLVHRRGRAARDLQHRRRRHRHRVRCGTRARTGTAYPSRSGSTQRAARALAALPTPSLLPEVTDWIEATSHPLIIDTTKAKRDLGWEPQYTGIQALRAALPENMARRGPAS